MERREDSMSQAALAGDLRVAEASADPASEAALVDLWVASWREAMPSIDFEARRSFCAVALRAPGHRLFVARSNGDPQGFATLEGDHLHQLVVATSAKGRGIAAALLDAVKAQASSGLSLDVNQDNARAVRFYEREGFAITGSGANPRSGLATFALRWAKPV